MEHVQNLLKEQMEEYNRILVYEILPFWMRKTDTEHGGFYTCYNVFGNHLVSKDKYVWSQGRCVWLYAKLAKDKSIAMPEEMRESLRELAVKGGRFLEEFCILPDGKAAFVLDENNQARTVAPHGGKSSSTFADCFVAMGLAAVGALEHNRNQMEKAFEILKRTARQMRDGTFLTAPDVLPKGWKSQAVYMIMMNTSYELAQSLEEFGADSEDALEEKMKLAQEVCRYAMNMEMNYFLTEDQILLECLDSNYQPLDTLYGRHINPGHTQECMWFLIKAARWLGDKEAEKKALKVIKHVARLSWDDRYGGMFYYLDRDGGQPAGSEADIETEAERELAEAALRDWSNKMWWPHLETVYANLMGFLYYGDEECRRLYEQYQEYTFRVFPNPDTSIGEWIQIRNRQGKPLTGTVGGRLPVKDPYHLIRTLMLLQNLIQEWTEQQSKK